MRTWLAALAVGLIVGCIVLLVIQPVAAPPTSGPISRAVTSTSKPLTDLQLSQPPPGQTSPPFWESAVVPDPARPRIPSPALIPARTAPPATVADTQDRIAALEGSPPTPANRDHLNQLTILYYAQDPAAAAAWLEQTTRFDDLAPGFASIAQSLASQGHAKLALEWLDLIADPARQRDGVIEVYRIAARAGEVTTDDLVAAGLTPAEIRLVFHGD